MMATGQTNDSEVCAFSVEGPRWLRAPQGRVHDLNGHKIRKENIS